MEQYAYVGCRTTEERNARGRGISVYSVSGAGQWKKKQLLPLENGLVNPSFLCLDRTGDFLYTVHGDESQISGYHIAEDGTLSYINTVSTGGTNPVHLSIDCSNQWIFVANLQTGTVSVIPRGEDGMLQPLKWQYTIPGNGDGMVSHPHQVQQDPTGSFLVVSCQGRGPGFGQVDVFRIHQEDGSLEKTCFVRSREIAEPRHFVFHPDGDWGYGVNEKDYSITFYHFDKEQGVLTPKQILPTLPDTYTGDGWASGIAMTSDGNFVIVSNRKHDSVSSFRIKKESGMLSFCDCIKTGGAQPRYIVWDEVRQLLVSANETSDTISEIILEKNSGKMRLLEQKIPTESPVCVIFKPL